MKIQNDLLTSALGGMEQAQKSTQNAGVQSDFANILADELSDSNAATGNLGLSAAKTSLMPSLAGTGKTGQKALSPEQKKIVDGLSAALDMLDEYTDMLAEQNNGSNDGNGDSGNMKKAYSLLDSITSSSGDLKNALANISKNPEAAGILNNPAIGDMVNELGVLATTEKFKMNRGDYFS